jgi:hypothetical protein
MYLPFDNSTCQGLFRVLGDIKSSREKMENKVEGVRGKGLIIVFK